MLVPPGLRVLLLPLLSTALLQAQQTPASLAGLGTVTGHITCADTGKPARFSTVIFFGIPKRVTAAPDLSSAKPEEAMASALEAMGDTNLHQSETGLDGSFTANDLAPGDYYAFAAVPGYVQPMSAVQALFQAGADINAPLPGVPVVHVAADRSSNVELRADRGAAVSGKVVWDDGSPVARAVVELAPPTGNPQPLPRQFGMLVMASLTGGSSRVITDDRGVFRISGLAAGSYVIKVSISSGVQMGLGASGQGLRSFASASPIVVWSPGVAHRAEAKAITLQSAEELSDQSVTLDLGRMHTISGRVLAQVDHHGINSAMVRLTDGSDKGFVRSAGVDGDGRYALTFVPAGTYTLTVTDAEDVKLAAGKKKTGLFGNQPQTLRKYEEGKSSALVTDGDLSAKDFELAAAKGKAAKLDDDEDKDDDDAADQKSAARTKD